MVPSTIRAVIFDMDGLMLDTETLSKRSWQGAARDINREISDELFLTFIGRTTIDCEAILREKWGSDFSFPPFYERIGFHWNDQVSREGIPLKPGLEELLAWLEVRGIPKAIATSSRRRGALPKLGALAQRFDHIVCGDDITRGKPAPDIFLLAAKRLGVPTSECLVLEDSHAGIAGAQAAGIYAIMVPDLLPPHDQVAHICASLHDVRLWLEQKA